MKSGRSIWILGLFLALLAGSTHAQQAAPALSLDFYGHQVNVNLGALPPQFQGDLTAVNLENFHKELLTNSLHDVVPQLLRYKTDLLLDDWLYYQLIRKVAQQISPKAANYYQYTMYKWFFLTRSGYDALLRIAGEKMLFFVRCSENIYNIPGLVKGDKQYVCLNYHDYGNSIDFKQIRFTDVVLPVADAEKLFSYKVTRLPDFDPAQYVEKKLQFSYHETDYQFSIKLNPQIKTIFANYPVVDYASYFNIPLSRETHNSLIPQLRRSIKGLSAKAGIDYLMHFTRSAFIFKPDTEVFGGEKRLTPEQTLLFDQSDCEDRAALFFSLVKELYNLPMIVLVYPEHVTVAVKFDKPVGKPVIYNGMKFSVCEPTPQRDDLSIGQFLPALKTAAYEVAYAYLPQ